MECQVTIKDHDVEEKIFKDVIGENIGLQSHTLV